jgi:glycosyltransferase involved in cell wall biosynthesis
MVTELLPKVSVIIPVYNGESDLPDLLECLREQTYPEDRVEYLIVDNGSTDGTVALLQDSVEVRRLSESAIQSSYAARNRGIIAATGEILVFTDADCRPERHWLQDLIMPFNQPAVGWVVGEVKALPGDSLLERFADRQETLSQKHTLAHGFYPYGQTANLAVRSEVFCTIGLFRPYLTTGGDADLCWRIQQHTAWQWRFAEQAVVRHRHRRTIDELRSQWQRYGKSNRYLHELHGIDLMPDRDRQYYNYRLARWILKEFPLALAKLPWGKSDLLDCIKTPIELVCVAARSEGQRTAVFPEAARAIAAHVAPDLIAD